MKPVYLLLASLLPLGACSWTTFDDLESETWVTSTEKPDNDSSNWGVAIQRGQASGSGGRLTVLGASQSLYSELQVGSDGDITVPATTLELNSQFGIGNLDAQPLLLADPASNDNALVTSSGSASIAVLRGAAGQLNVHQIFGPANPDAATYMVPGANGLSQTLVAEGDKVYGTFFVNPPNPQPSCKLVDAGNQQVVVRALGALPTAAASDVIVWSSTGKVLVYPGAPLFNGCATQAPTASAATDTAVKPAKGSQILPFVVGTARFALLQGHEDAGASMIALFSLDGTPTLVGTARMETGAKSAALFESGTKRYVVVGYPAAIVDGTTGAGQALVFEVDTTSGIGSATVITLHDAQPESNQAFGRSVAAMPFDGKPVIVVAADNEIFTYFRASPVYEETRAGR